MSLNSAWVLWIPISISKNSKQESLVACSSGGPPLLWVALAWSLILNLCLNTLRLSPNLAQVQRNCCLTLCNFSIPEELEFQYRRVNELLLSILSPTRQDESIQRIAVHLCNALVCQVDNDHKEAVGKMGFVVVRVLVCPCQTVLCEQGLRRPGLWGGGDDC